MVSIMSWEFLESQNSYQSSLGEIWVNDTDDTKINSKEAKVGGESFRFFITFNFSYGIYALCSDYLVQTEPLT